jgi:hypothetical protein
MLHGSYDFFLFASSFLAIILEKDGFALEVGALVISVTLTICGSIYAYRGFRKVNYVVIFLSLIVLLRILLFRLKTVRPLLRDLYCPPLLSCS